MPVTYGNKDFHRASKTLHGESISKELAQLELENALLRRLTDEQEKESEFLCYFIEENGLKIPDKK